MASGMVVARTDLQSGVCSSQVKVCGGVNGWTEPAYQQINGYEVAAADL
ncbi:MAG: hypothetical protein QF416_08610 [Candidatus Marinimicrobia bacterium]|nr:hypothetical protein [Candidatus Neomarinimicrobiota bacterium]